MLCTVMFVKYAKGRSATFNPALQRFKRDTLIGQCFNRKRFPD
jgi:hypothetical protein